MVNVSHLPVNESEDRKLFPAIIEKADVQIESDAIVGRVYGALFLCARKIRNLVENGKTVDEALDSEELHDSLIGVQAAVENGSSEFPEDFDHSVKTHIPAWEKSFPQPCELYTQGGQRVRSSKNHRKF